MRKFPNKSDSIRDQNREILTQLDAPDQCIQRGEQSARYERVFLRQGAEQRRFAGVRIANQRNERQLIPPAPFAMKLAVLAELSDVALQHADLMPNLPAIRFQFRFTG